ncbi:hypothetical protein QFZ37_002380 [Chryseobacterium ginsenosidimutans]|nr:hypothetical protein [Chryseobacterium ginsenosidimutans]
MMKEKEIIREQNYPNIKATVLYFKLHEPSKRRLSNYKLKASGYNEISIPFTINFIIIVWAVE